MITTVLLSAAAGIVAVILFVPICVRMSGAAGEDELWGVAELRWGHSIAMARIGTETGGRVYLFGLPVFRLPAFSKSSEEKRKKKRKSKSKNKRNKPKGSTLAQLWHNGRRVMPPMVARGLRALHPHLYVGGTVGLGDPASAGLMLTSVHQIDHLITDRVKIDIRDDFLEDSTQLFGRLRAWIVPAEIALVLIVWMVRSDTRRMLLGK